MDKHLAEMSKHVKKMINLFIQLCCATNRNMYKSHNYWSHKDKAAHDITAKVSTVWSQSVQLYTSLNDLFFSDLMVGMCAAEEELSSHLSAEAIDQMI